MSPEQTTEKKYAALKAHVLKLLQNSFCYPSAIEIDSYSEARIDGDAWGKEAWILIGEQDPEAA